MKRSKNLMKSAVFTDLHFGKKANSTQHNQDCLNFIDWFIEQVELEGDVDHIMFLGDWHENRSALNISTLNTSYEAARRLNQIGLPVFFLVGNHDLYHRHSRDVHSVKHLAEFDNFTVIDEITIADNIGKEGVLFVPYIFHNEYTQLVKYLDIPFWAGHFEFKGFEVTGHGMVMPVGPEPDDFQGPKHIVSGHFHKRQTYENIIYMGNTFPMDFGDAGDANRGMMFHDHETDEMRFRDWPNCPKYTKTKLTDILDNSVALHPNSRVKCIVDVPISFEESTALRQSFIEKYNLREFTLEESHELRQALSETESGIDWEESDQLASVDEIVQQMLQEIDTDQLDNNKLVSIYNELKTQQQ